MNGEKINLFENGKNISNDTELCNILYLISYILYYVISTFFPNIPKKYHCFLNNVDSDSVLFVLNPFENHPNIKNTKSKELKNIKSNSIFCFENIYADVVMEVINNLNIKMKTLSK